MAQATVLQYLHPVFTALLAFLFLGAPDHRNACLYRTEPAASHVLSRRIGGARQCMPVFCPFGGSVGAFGSGGLHLVRKLVATEHPSVIVLYFPLVCLPGTLLGGGDLFGRPSPGGGCYSV